MPFLEAWLPLQVTVTIAFVIGLLIGSFLNVVIHRTPLGLSIVSPGSACPSCSRPITPLDNIPILSFALLRGRCRHCKERISPAYPLVELTTGVLFSVIVWLHGPTVASAAECWFASVMLVLAVIDARHHILPDRITYPSLVIATVASISRSPVMADLDLLISSPEPGFSAWQAALIGTAVILAASVSPWLLDQLDVVLFEKYFDWEEEETEDAPDPGIYVRLTGSTVLLGLILGMLWTMLVLFDSKRDPELYQVACDRLLDAGFGALFGAAALWIVRAGYFYLRGAEGMGLGDVKLMMVIGAFLGWPGAVLVLLIASFIGLAIGLAMARQSGEGLKTKLPLGACLGLASIIVLVLLDGL